MFAQVVINICHLAACLHAQPLFLQPDDSVHAGQVDQGPAIVGQTGVDRVHGTHGQDLRGT
jgi:hypothetical protein